MSRLTLGAIHPNVQRLVLSACENTPPDSWSVYRPLESSTGNQHTQLHQGVQMFVNLLVIATPAPLCHGWKRMCLALNEASITQRWLWRSSDCPLASSFSSSNSAMLLTSSALALRFSISSRFHWTTPPQKNKSCTASQKYNSNQSYKSCGASEGCSLFKNSRLNIVCVLK